MSHTTESCHTCATCTGAWVSWVLSLQLSHVTYHWVMSYATESCHIEMSHVTYKWVMSHTIELCHTSTICTGAGRCGSCLLIFIYIYKDTHLYMRVHMCHHYECLLYIYIYTYPLNIRTHIHVHIHIHIYTYTYTHTCTYTYTYTYTFVRAGCYSSCRVDIIYMYRETHLYIHV